MRHKIVIASPSHIERTRLAKLLTARQDVEVIALAADLSETLTISGKSEPTLVILTEDLCMSAEFDSIKSLFYAIGARWIKLKMNDGQADPVSMIVQPRGQVREPSLDLGMDVEAIIQQISQVLALDRTNESHREPLVSTRVSAGPERVVLIGASTGGVDALLTLLSSYPKDCPPTAIVQLTGKGFSDGLIRLLNRR